MRNERDPWSGMDKSVKKSAPPENRESAKPPERPSGVVPRERKVDPMLEARIAAQETAKKIARAQLEKQLPDVTAARGRLTKDSPARNGLSREEIGFLQKFVETVAQSNDKVSAAMLNEGLSISSGSSGQFLEAGRKSLIEKLFLKENPFSARAANILNQQGDPKEALKVMEAAVEQAVRETAQREANKREKVEREKKKALAEAEKKRQEWKTAQKEKEQKKGIFGRLFGGE